MSVATVALKFTVGSTVTRHTGTYMSVGSVGADSTVSARAYGAEILLSLTMFTLPTWFTIAFVIVDELSAISGSVARAWIG